MLLPTPTKVTEAKENPFLPLQSASYFLPLQTVTLVETSAFNQNYQKLTYKTNLFQGQPRYILDLQLLQILKLQLLLSLSNPSVHATITSSCVLTTITSYSTAITVVGWPLCLTYLERYEGLP